jgi:hypothetical protein
MPSPARSNPHEGVTRREIIKRAAIAGGVAWAAPVIQSITTPAFAQTTPRCTAGCFWVKISPDEPGGCVDANGTVFCPDCLQGNTQSPDGCPCVVNLVTQNCEWTLAPLPAGCTFLGGYSKCAGNLCEPAVVNPDGSVTFPPCPKAGGGVHCVSHIEFCYCCS